MLFDCGNDTLIRDWRESDADALQRLADDREIWINLRDRFPHPYTTEDARTFIASSLAADPVTSWAIEDRKELAGAIGVILRNDVHRVTAEIGYWIGRPHWNRGVATRALRTFGTYAFRAFDVLRLEAEVFEWNAASCRVLEKCGYVREGVMRRAAIKDGTVIDYSVYALHCG